MAGRRALSARDLTARGSPPLFAVILAGFCAFLDLYATQPLLPLLSKLFHATEVAVSLTVTLATGGVAIAAPAVGAFADRLGRKRVILGSIVLLAASTVLTATSRNLHQLIFWRFLQGLFTPGIFAITIAYIHEEWPVEFSGRALTAYVAGTVIGGFSGRMLAGLVATHADWQWAFVILGALTFAGAGALGIWLPRERRFRPASMSRSTWRALAGHLQNGQLIATYVVGFCVLFTMTASFTYVNFYLAAPPFYLRPAALGSIFFVYLIGAAITPACGRFIDRYGHKRALSIAMAAGIGGITLTLEPRLAAVIAGLAICCTGVFIAQAASTGHIGLVAEGDRALAVGLYVMCYYVGGSAGAAVPGLLWSAGGWPACVALIAAVQALTVTLASLLWTARKGYEHAAIDAGPALD
jgi:predicted MFS family arabinose efflux permease